MAFPVPSYRLTALFAIQGTDETAAFDLSVARGVPGVLPDITADEAAGFHDAVQAFLTATGSGRAVYSRFTGVKVAKLGTNGRYAQDPVTYPSSNVNVGGLTAVAPQLSVCVSLRAAQSLGTGNRGRFFVPHSGGIEPNLYRMNTGQRDTFAVAGAELVRDVNNVMQDLDPGVRVAIMSQAGLAGSSKEVVAVRVGRVVDTQRRRRAQLEEEYVTEAV